MLIGAFLFSGNLNVLFFYFIYFIFFLFFFYK
jgi:hypothetical protein